VTDLLTPKQLAEYLQLSHRTVYRLLERGSIPAVRVGGQWRFRKASVDYWLDVLMARMSDHDLSAITEDVPSDSWIVSLLARENALIRVRAGTRDESVRHFIEQVRFPEPVDREEVVRRVLEREDLCSTALPDGVALLHTDRARPRVMRTADLVAVGRLGGPIDFGALDGTRTDLFILVLARDERTHLRLLAKMTRLCRESDVCAMLRQSPDADAVMAELGVAVRRLFTPAGGAA
jgi:PTS system nitrogen regulatory IIA component